MASCWNQGSKKQQQASPVNSFVYLFTDRPILSVPCLSNPSNITTLTIMNVFKVNMVFRTDACGAGKTSKNDRVSTEHKTWGISTRVPLPGRRRPSPGN